MSSRDPSRGRGAARLVVCAPALVLASSACSWFSKSPPPVAPRPDPPVLSAPVYDDAQPATAARAACANYATAFEDSPFPLDAIVRGIDSGTAAVRFRVDGTALTILTITSSDPAFGDAAVRIVRKLQCRVDRPTIFEIPLAWRSVR